MFGIEFRTKECERICVSPTGMEPWVSKDLKLFSCDAYFGSIEPKLNVICRFSIILHLNHRHMRLQTFLLNIQFWTIFIRSFSSYYSYFQQSSTQKWKYFFHYRHYHTADIHNMPMQTLLYRAKNIKFFGITKFKLGIQEVELLGVLYYFDLNSNLYFFPLCCIRNLTLIFALAWLTKNMSKPTANFSA